MNKLPRGSLIGPYPYRVLQQLGEGEGGMSLIYLATVGDRDPADPNNLVALKIANVDSPYRQFYVETLDNEVEHLRALRHPNIVRLHRIIGQTLPPNPIFSAQTNLTGRPWFSVMEYLAGGSLAELIKKEKRLHPGLALAITRIVAETLAFIHSQGRIHLDIKPENVVFRRPTHQDIEPVLVDFGIARALGQVGLEAGTLQWSPPERIIHSESKNLPPEMMARPHPSMDVYALGLLLYRMVAGRLPFEGSRKNITSAILQGNPTQPSTHEPSLQKSGLDELILGAIAKEPGARPSTEAFARQVAALQQQPLYQDYRLPSSPSSPSSSGSPSALGSQGRSVPPRFLAGALGLALLAGGVGLWQANADPDEPLRVVVSATPMRAVTVSPTERRATASPSRTASPRPTEDRGIGATSTSVPTHTPAPPPATRVPPTRTPVPPTRRPATPTP